MIVTVSFSAWTQPNFFAGMMSGTSTPTVEVTEVATSMPVDARTAATSPLASTSMLALTEICFDFARSTRTWVRIEEPYGLRIAWLTWPRFWVWRLTTRTLE